MGKHSKPALANTCPLQTPVYKGYVLLNVNPLPKVPLNLCLIIDASENIAERLVKARTLKLVKARCLQMMKAGALSERSSTHKWNMVNYIYIRAVIKLQCTSQYLCTNS